MILFSAEEAALGKKKDNNKKSLYSLLLQSSRDAAKKTGQLREESVDAYIKISKKQIMKNRVSLYPAVWYFPKSDIEVGQHSWEDLQLAFEPPARVMRGDE